MQNIPNLLCWQFCPSSFRRKAMGHSIWLSILPSNCPSVPLQVVSTFCMQLLYSLTALYLKLYRCLGHGLKMCILSGYTCNPQLISCHFFHKMNSVIFLADVIDTGYLVYVTLLLQFYFDSFETLLVFRSLSENVHNFWI